MTERKRFEALRGIHGHYVLEHIEGEEPRAVTPEMGKVAAQEVAHALNAARAQGLRDGFNLAEEDAEISTHDGWHTTEPNIDWSIARERLTSELKGCDDAG